MSLAEKLVSLRKQKGLTQMDLAEQLNVSRQAISRWEVGAAVPSTDNLKVLSDLYGVSVDYLLDDGTTVSDECIVVDQSQPEEQTEIRKGTKYRWIVICIASVLILAAIILFGWVKIQEQNRDPVIPMENMQNEAEQENLTDTFPFE